MTLKGNEISKDDTDTLFVALEKIFRPESNETLAELTLAINECEYHDDCAGDYSKINSYLVSQSRKYMTNC